VRPGVGADAGQQVDVLGDRLEHRGPGLPDRLGDPRGLVGPSTGGLDQLTRDPSVPLVVVRQRGLPPGVRVAPQNRERPRPIGPPTLPDARRNTRREPSASTDDYLPVNMTCVSAGQRGGVEVAGIEPGGWCWDALARAADLRER